MIEARHTFFGKLLANHYSGTRLDKAFHSVKIEGEADDDGSPVLMIANHFSWWDGFIQYRLNDLYFHRKLHVMMLEEQLRRFMVLNQCGVFSIRKNSRDIVKSLHYCSELLSVNSNMVLIFPQGKIESMHRGYLSFEKGLSYFLKPGHSRFQLIFNVNLIDFFSEKKPSLTIYFKKFKEAEPAGVIGIEKSFNDFVTDCKFRQKA